ncbi:MAG: aldehyde dehydrogenase (NADP(+)) [Proteobacteria bacterium]|nr:aldehyde dehydrogenase (NADP(+)) [Pseudomonadota bacterium]
MGKEVIDCSLIGNKRSKSGTGTYQAVNPLTSKKLEPHFYNASLAEVDEALKLAEQSFNAYRSKSKDERAVFLETISAKILALGDELINVASEESGLPVTRLESERLRTVNQLKMFAALVREGSWVDVRIDKAIPDRQPVPKPDLRRKLIPIGPVVVFGASNFPLAFSVAGGDTASALAAGNPVIVKAHPAHPRTSSLVAQVIIEAANSCKMPEGVFSLIHGSNFEIGVALVEHPLTCAVGFTGSLQGGRALFDIAARRPNPIPVFAEMGSVNPCFILPQALSKRAEAIANGIFQSFTGSVGQFCVKPGLVFVVESEELNKLCNTIASLTTASIPQTMLHSGICNNFTNGVSRLKSVPGVELLAKSNLPGDPLKTQAETNIFLTSSEVYLKNNSLTQEVFGPVTIIVKCHSVEEMCKIAYDLEGQLTSTLHAENEELAEARKLISILERKAGRLVFNGYPTGLEVCPSTNHTGPYPATTDSRSTSVGTAAILRFVRPICYQNFPSELLDEELR